MKKRTNAISILICLLSFVSCNKAELTSCEVDVYHKGEIRNSILNEIQDEALYEKGWTLNFVEMNDSTDIDKTRQHAKLIYKNRYSVNDKVKYATHITNYAFPKKYAYSYAPRYKRSCKTKVSVYIPEIAKTFNLEHEATSLTGYYYRVAEYNEISDWSEGCVGQSIEIVKKLPTCVEK